MVAKTSNESISDLLNSMRSLLIVAGVPREQIQIRANKPQIQTIAKAFDWLHDLKMSPEYIALFKVRNLLPESMWEKYELLDIEGLREQELLKDAGKKVLKLWKTKRPTVLNKKKKRPETDNYKRMTMHQTPIADR